MISHKWSFNIDYLNMRINEQKLICQLDFISSPRDHYSEMSRQRQNKCRLTSEAAWAWIFTIIQLTITPQIAACVLTR